MRCELSDFPYLETVRCFGRKWQAPPVRAGRRVGDKGLSPFINGNAPRVTEITLLEALKPPVFRVKTPDTTAGGPLHPVGRFHLRMQEDAFSHQNAARGIGGEC